MAKKSHIFRLGQAIRGYFEIADRPSVQLPATLYLIRLRTVPLKIPIPKELKPPRKITIEIEVQSPSTDEEKIGQPA
ncbi:MAG TPA: hypothetical protein VN625_04410 [Desulfuromonadaceae bacterium]|nr:hypothetical protein [Desulfuromonadaceae bacterium]